MLERNALIEAGISGTSSSRNMTLDAYIQELESSEGVPKSSSII